MSKHAMLIYVGLSVLLTAAAIISFVYGCPAVPEPSGVVLTIVGAILVIVGPLIGTVAVAFYNLDDGYYIGG